MIWPMLLLEKSSQLLEKVNVLVIKTGAVLRWYFRNLNKI